MADREQDFLAFARGDDPTALERVVTPLLDGAYAQARRVLGDAADAEDAVQEALVRLLRTRERYDGRVALTAWLGRLVHDAARDVARGRRRRRRREGVAASIPVTTPSDESSFATVRAAVAALPERQRVAVELHYFAGVSQPEAARALGLTENAIGVRLHRARERLRRALGDGALAALAAPPCYPLPAGVARDAGSLITGATAAVPVVLGGIAAGWTLAAAAALLTAAGWWAVRPENAPRAEPPIAHPAAAPEAPSAWLSQALSRHVSFDFGERYLGPGLTLLAREAGVVVIAPTALDRLVVTLRAADEPVGEVLKRLAHVAGLRLELRGDDAALWRDAPPDRLAELEQRLRSDDVQTRCEAVADLRRLGDPRAIALVARAIGDPEPAVVAWALTIDFGDHRDSYQDLRVLRLATDPATTSAAIADATRRVPGAVDPARAAVAIAALGGEERIALARRIAADGGAATAVVAGAALALPDAAAAATLAAAARSKDAAGTTAAKALARWPTDHAAIGVARIDAGVEAQVDRWHQPTAAEISDWIPGLHGVDHGEQSAAALASAWDERARDALVAILADPVSRTSMRSTVGAAIAAAADPAFVARLEPLLVAAEVDVRRWAAWSLCGLRDPRAVPALLPLVDDPDAEVRQTTRSGFAANLPVEAAALFASRPEGPESDAVMGRIRDPRAVPRLMRLPRSSGATQLLPDPRAIGPLARLARNGNAAEHLGLAPTLSSFASDPEAQAALIALLDETPVRREAIWFISSWAPALGQPLRDRLLIALDDPEAFVAMCAAKAFCGHPDARAVPTLIRRLEQLGGIAKSALEAYLPLATPDEAARIQAALDASQVQANHDGPMEQFRPLGGEDY